MTDLARAMHVPHIMLVVCRAMARVFWCEREGNTDRSSTIVDPTHRLHHRFVIACCVGVTCVLCSALGVPIDVSGVSDRHDNSACLVLAQRMLSDPVAWKQDEPTAHGWELRDITTTGPTRWTLIASIGKEEEHSLS